MFIRELTLNLYWLPSDRVSEEFLVVLHSCADRTQDPVEVPVRSFLILNKTAQSKKP
jgi:hypothetical protein